jgi:hypothetical protein
MSFSPRHYIKQRAQIHTYHTENVLSWNTIIRSSLDDTQQQKTLEEAEEREPEPKDRIMTVLTMIWGALIHWNWHQDVWGHWSEWEASTNYTRNYKDSCLLRFWSRKDVFVYQISLLIFCMSPSGFHVLPPLLLDNGHNDPHDSPTVHEDAPPP